MENREKPLMRQKGRVHSPGGKIRRFSTEKKKKKNRSLSNIHISPFFGGLVEKRGGGDYSYLPLMLALISLMISAISGDCFTMVSTCLMECMTVV